MKYLVKVFRKYSNFRCCGRDFVIALLFLPSEDFFTDETYLCDTDTGTVVRRLQLQKQLRVKGELYEPRSNLHLIECHLTDFLT